MQTKMHCWTMTTPHTRNKRSTTQESKTTQKHKQQINQPNLNNNGVADLSLTVSTDHFCGRGMRMIVRACLVPPKDWSKIMNLPSLLMRPSHTPVLQRHLVPAMLPSCALRLYLQTSPYASGRCGPLVPRTLWYGVLPSSPFTCNERIQAALQEPFVLDSRTNRNPSLRTNHFSNHLYWIHVHNKLVSLCTPWAVCTPTTFRLRSVYVPSTFRPHAFVAVLISPSAFECVRSTTCVP